MGIIVGRLKKRFAVVLRECKVALGSSLRNGQRPTHSSFQWGQIIFDRVPDRFDIYPVILMPKPISNSANVAPWNAGAKRLGILSNADRRFADHEQLPLDCSLRLCIPGIVDEVHATDEYLNELDTLVNVAQMRSGVAKRQGLTRGQLPEAQALSTSLPATDRPWHQASLPADSRCEPS